MIFHPALAFPALLALAAPAAAEERRYMLTGFDSVRVEGPYEVRIAAGGPAAAVATGDTRAFESIEVRVEARTLIVRAGVEAWGGFPGARRAAPRIAVTVPALRAASVVGGGKLSVDRMAGQRIDLRLTGAGSIAVADARADQIEATIVGTGAITLGGRAQRGRFTANGAGTIDAGALALSSLWVDWQSVGEARFAARYTAEIYARGQGPVTVAGEPACKVFGEGPATCGPTMTRR